MAWWVRGLRLATGTAVGLVGLLIILAAQMTVLLFL